MNINIEQFDPAFHIVLQSDGSLAKVIRTKIKAWITSPWFVDLLELFDGHIALQGRLEEVLERLEIFSDRWDFRRMARERGVPTDDKLRQGFGAARWLTAATHLSEDAEARILEDARHLGLVHAQDPIQSSYNYILVLGGARLSCKLRPMRAVEVIRAGIRVNAVALLGAARPVVDSERDATDTYAPRAVDEFDLIVAGAQQAFGFDERTFDEERYDHPSNSNLGWVVRHFKASFEGLPLRVLAMAAPSSDPLRRRANSADTLVFFLDWEKVPPNSKLLLITSQIYVPYVQLEALRTIAVPRQLLVETIGFPGDRMREIQGLSSTNHYLQEIRSTIQAARRFCQAYAE